MRRWLLAASCSVMTMANCGCQQKPAPSAELLGAATSVTFSRDVAPIVFQKCSSCHHSGEAAPFSLLTYDDVRRRARQIVDVTQRRFMPPWLPTEGQGGFVGERRLTDHERPRESRTGRNRTLQQGLALRSTHLARRRQLSPQQSAPRIARVGARLSTGLHVVGRASYSPHAR